MLRWLARRTAEPIEEGFVAFGNGGFVPVLSVLVDSVLTFSKRPIVVYGVDTDLPITHPRVIVRRIPLGRPWWRRPSVNRFMAVKPRVIAECGIRYGAYLDADCVVSRGIDQLFEWAREVEDYPLCPIHESDPDNQQQHMRALGVTHKTMPYVHGHVVFSHRCGPFIDEWKRVCDRLIYRSPCADETLLNVLLWKHGATRHLPPYDPYFETIDRYLAGDAMRPLLFHGCKDAHRAGEMLIALRNTGTVC